MRYVRLVVAVFFLFAGLAPAFAAKHALLIGINDYQEIPKLQKAVGDARALAALLKTTGYQTHIIENAGRRDLNRRISRFLTTVNRGDVVLLHFSGHGIQIAGKNYLLPADVPKPSSGEQDYVRDESIDLSKLMERVAATGASARLFVIDACRDNPFAATGVRSIGGTRGLARVEPPQGSFVLFSAGYGQQALDRLGENDPEPTSVYTRTLLKHMRIPGKVITDIAVDVRSEVQKLAKLRGHLQRPAYYDDLTSSRSFKFLPGSGGGKPTPGETGGSKRLDAFKLAKAVGTAKSWDQFLRRFPDGADADYAREERQRLKRLEANKTVDNGRITMKLTTGRVVIRLRPELAPKHVSRIKTLVKEKFYDGTVFHRVIDGFMAQGGDPTGTGSGGSGYPNLTAEFSTSPFRRGTVAAARASDPNSANSQFFICLSVRGCKHLKGQYTIWGEVVEGMAAVDKIIRNGKRGYPSKVISARIGG